MTVNEVIEEMIEYVEMGYGDKPLYWMVTNQERVEVQEISPLWDGSGLEVL
jgi:hypothetical protein